MFLEAIDKLAPLLEVRIKQRTELWMNGDILEDIKKTRIDQRILKRNTIRVGQNTKS